MNTVPHPTGARGGLQPSTLKLEVCLSPDRKVLVTPKLGPRSNASTLQRFNVSTTAFPEVHARPNPFTSVTVEQVTIPIWKTRWRDKKRRKTYVSYTLAWRDAT